MPSSSRCRYSVLARAPLSGASPKRACPLPRNGRRDRPEASASFFANGRHRFLAAGCFPMVGATIQKLRGRLLARIADFVRAARCFREIVDDRFGLPRCFYTVSVIVAKAAGCL